MSFGKLYKYKITDLTINYYSQSGSMGECYLSIAPSREQIISEYYKKCSQKDKDTVDNNYDLFKTQITCGKLPNTIFILFKDMAIASFEPQRDQ
ncbi:hypothetical protein EBR43_03880 [bacterium]|nr:hypothetical protein [bacterium]